MTALMRHLEDDRAADEASSGSLYGTTTYGGTNDFGTVFELLKK